MATRPSDAACRLQDGIAETAHTVRNRTSSSALARSTVLALSQHRPSTSRRAALDHRLSTLGMMVVGLGVPRLAASTHSMVARAGWAVRPRHRLSIRPTPAYFGRRPAHQPRVTAPAKMSGAGPSVEIVAQRLRTRWMPELAHALRLDLPDPFAGQSIDRTDLVERSGSPVNESEP
jgi:hypothetical protein